MRTHLIVPMFALTGALFTACGETDEPTGAGGTVGVGGATPGVGGSTPGVGGATPGVGGAGGAPAPMGGAGGAPAPMGGAGGVSPMGGAGGVPPMGGAGGAPPGDLTIESLFPIPAGETRGFDGMTFSVACKSASGTDDCDGAGWVLNGAPPVACIDGGYQGGQRLVANKSWTVAGQVDTVYQVNMHFYGIMEPYLYSAAHVERLGGTGPADLTGAKPAYGSVNAAGLAPAALAAKAYRDSNDPKFNTYELHVKDAAGVTKAIHLFNTDADHGHWTILVNFEKEIPIYGGGSVELQIYDFNCKQIKNCGTGASQGSQCATKAQEISTAAVVPATLPSFNPPELGLDKANAGQWFIIDVLGIKPQ